MTNGFCTAICLLQTRHLPMRPAGAPLKKRRLPCILLTLVFAYDVGVRGADLSSNIYLACFIAAILYGLAPRFAHKLGWREQKTIMDNALPVLSNLIVTDKRVIAFADNDIGHEDSHMIIIERGQIENVFLDYENGGPVLALRAASLARPVTVARYQIEQARAAIEYLIGKTAPRKQA